MITPLTAGDRSDFADTATRALLEVVPPTSRVLVVSKGDDELPTVPGVTVMGFPQLPSGQCAGFYPFNSLAAIAGLEAARAAGARYLLFTDPSMWWLEFYDEFRTYLDARYPCFASEAGRYALYSLEASDGASIHGLARQFLNVIVACQRDLGLDPSVLDWSSELNLASLFPDVPVFSPPGVADVLPYLDRTADVVALRSGHPLRMEEALRVASVAVVTVESADEASNPGTAHVDVRWLIEPTDGRTTDVSVVVPAAGKQIGAQSVVDAVAETAPPNLGIEILVAADAIAGHDLSLSDASSNIQVRRVTVAAGASVAERCNACAHVAQGDIIVFLPPDSVPLLDWLPSLGRIFREYPDAGVATFKLLSCDGQLLEAGAFVQENDTAVPIGDGTYTIDDPLLNYVRRVDCSCSLLLATRRTLFLRLGGFRRRKSRAEAVEYCARVRSSGPAVYYQPAAVAVQLHGYGRPAIPRKEPPSQ